MTTAKVKSVVETLSFEKWKKIIATQRVQASNVVFRMFTTWTVCFLICFALITLLYQSNVLEEDKRPIKCLGNGKVSSDPQKQYLKTVETYCFFVSTTYTLPDKDLWLGRKATHKGKSIKYNAYYQWVPFVLFLQAVLFRFPYIIWKNLEGRRLSRFCNKILPPTQNKDSTKVKVEVQPVAEFVDNINPKPELKNLSRVLKDYSSAGLNQKYALGFIFCELLNLGVLLGNMYYTNYFLGGEFQIYGKEVFQLLLKDPNLRNDPMNYVFPKETKCDFRIYGPGGSIQVKDYLCVLPVNILNEKIYAFLWFWFLILLGMSILGLLYRVIVLSSSKLRSISIKWQLCHSSQKFYNSIDARLSYWDWFVLKKLLDNLNEIRFGHLCENW